MKQQPHNIDNYFSIINAKSDAIIQINDYILISHKKSMTEANGLNESLNQTCCNTSYSVEEEQTSFGKVCSFWLDKSSSKFIFSILF